MIDILPQETALLVIDPQNDYCHPEGILAMSGVDVSVWNETTPKIAELIKVCQAAGIRDIWTRHYNYADDQGRAQKRLKPHTAKRKTVTAQPGSWGSEFVDELKPLIGEKSNVVDKYRFSAFYGTTLETLLEIFGTKLLIICGGTTNACVDTTIRDAYIRNYDIVIVEDCIAGIRKDWHEMAVQVWKQYLGEIVKLDDLPGLIKKA
ncbi:MAG: cysteine hydrolase family protein [Rhizobiaceae bacterium]